MSNNRDKRDTSFILRSALLATALAAPIASSAGIAPGMGGESMGAAQSATPVPSMPIDSVTGTVSAGQLAQTESRIAMLKMQLEIAKLHAEIAKENAQAKHPDKTASPSASPYGGMLPAGAVPPFSLTPQSKSSSHKEKAPRVLSLIGADGHYQATLALPNGELMTVVNGSRLGNGWRVLRISAAGVTVTHAGKVIPLGFDGSSGYPVQGDAPVSAPGTGFVPQSGSPIPSFTPPQPPSFTLPSGSPMSPNNPPMVAAPKG